MYQPVIRPIIQSILSRDKSEDIKYVSLNLVRKGVQQGYYYDINGVKIMDPLKIFVKNNMPKFTNIDDMFVFLEKVDYVKWKNCEYDADFVIHHIDLVKKMYITHEQYDKKKHDFRLIYGLLEAKIEHMKNKFHTENRLVLVKFKKLFYNIYGDDYDICD